MKIFFTSIQLIVVFASIMFVTPAFSQPGSNDSTFNPGQGANDIVATTAIQSDGKIIIGGSFTTYNGTAINYIARLNTNGTLDATFNPGSGLINSPNTVAIQSDGKIIIGSYFSPSNATINYIARLNTDGSLDGTFNAGTPGPYFIVHSTAIRSDGKIIIGGQFTSYNGTSRNCIARLNSDGTLDATFNPGTGTDLPIYTTTILSNGNIIISGQFTSYNGISKNYIARLNSDGTLDATFNTGTGANSYIYTTAIQSDGKIVIGGYFTSYNGISRNHIARLNADGTLDTTFNPGTGTADYGVNTTAIQSDGKIIIGGFFNSYNGTSRNFIARLNTNGALDSTFNPGTGANGIIYTTATQSDGKIIIGGQFTSYNGTSRNYVARILVTAISSSSDYFRTITNGNWNSPSTWESSPLSDFSSGLASPATLTPDNNSNGITIRNGHTVTVTANVSTDHTIVNPLGVLTVTGSTLTVLNNGLTLKSDATGTARIGNSSGTISSNVIVERYIPNNGKRAWRLLSIPTSGSQTIKSSWQNGQNPAIAGPSGLGTWITGNVGDSNFDAQTSRSMLIYNNLNNTLIGIPSTLMPISRDNGYFIFIRGDRTATNSNTIITATTLSTTGNLKQGNYPSTPMSVTASQFGLIGNPYVSQIDFRNVTKGSGIDNTFYVWDPKLAGSYGLGAYQTLTLSRSNYIITPGGGSYGTSGSIMNTIETGQAFFVHATSTDNISFTENAKSSGSNNVFRTSSTPAKSLITNLYSVESSVDELTDGTMSLFDNSYSNTVDAMDAQKLTNFGVNLGITTGNKILSVEKRNSIKADDVIYFNLNNTKQQQYRFEFIANGIDQPGLTAFLADNYLKTNTPVDLNGTTSINFVVTSDSASSAANRFSLTFGKPAIENTKPAIVIYPNPVVNGNIKLQFNNMAKGIYNVKILNTAGQTVTSKRINHSEGSSIETITVNKIKGAYLLEITNPHNSKTTNKIILD